MSEIKKRSPMVSVIMSSYNHERYVSEAIESVLAQSYTEFEFLIADDGSSDGTQEKIKSFSDERICYFEYDVNTSFKTLDMLRERARGKYIAQIGSDDVWRKDKLEKQVVFLEQNPQYAVCFSWIETIDENSHVVKGEGSKNSDFNLQNKKATQWFAQLFWGKESLPTPSFMMRTELFQKYGGFHFKYRQIHDYELWLRILLNHEIYIMPEQLLFYRWHVSDEHHNISAPSTRGEICTYNEMHHMFGMMIETIPDDYFIMTFGDKLFFPDCHTHEQIMCERMILLLNHPNRAAQQVGIDFYLTYIDDMEFCRCLEEEYGITRKIFHELEASRGLMAEVSEQREQLIQCQEMLKKVLQGDEQ